MENDLIECKNDAKIFVEKSLTQIKSQNSQQSILINRINARIEESKNTIKGFNLNKIFLQKQLNDTKNECQKFNNCFEDKMRENLAQINAKMDSLLSDLNSLSVIENKMKEAGNILFHSTFIFIQHSFLSNIHFYYN